MNDEVGRVESMSITDNVGVGRKRTGKILHKIDVSGHKYFFENVIKTEEGTLSRGVVKKDTQTRFGVKFVGRVRMQPRKT